MAPVTEKERSYKGIVASPGYAIGKAFVLNRFHLCVVRHDISSADVKKEKDRFHHAVEVAKDRMLQAARKSVKNLEENLNYILNPQIQLLNDPTITNGTKHLIETEHVNAEWALKETYDRMASRFQKIKNPFFKERLQDFERVVNMVLQVLTGHEHETLEELTDPVVVIAHDLSPFDTAQMAKSKILGFITEVGGKTSHTGIIASSLRIPALAGVHHITDNVRTGQPVVVDGISGQVVVNPTHDHFLNYNKKRVDYLWYDKQFESEVSEETRTLDGERIHLKGNIESHGELSSALEHGAEGIGLYRSEFLYITGFGFPGEDAQYEEYKKIAHAVDEHSAVIRTLDIGGDKMPWTYQEEEEANPALGLRAIRYCLGNRAIFNTQIRAILRASTHGNLKIMFPMISGVEELRKARTVLERQKRELRKDGIPFNENIAVGMMVEVPSAAMVIEQFAPYVDFFSVGTNDLIQYMLAIDRGNERVAHIYEPLHPAVLRMLSHIIKTANRTGVPVSVCGRMAADPLYAYLLVGMGEVADLSMGTLAIPKVKKFIRSIHAAQARRDVEKVLTYARVSDVRSYLLKKVAPLMEKGIISQVQSEDYGKGLYR